jgi:hypothetical protein
MRKNRMEDGSLGGEKKMKSAGLMENGQLMSRWRA